VAYLLGFYTSEKFGSCDNQGFGLQYQSQCRAVVFCRERLHKKLEPLRSILSEELAILVYLKKKKNYHHVLQRKISYMLFTRMHLEKRV
jgi:hypothetical protein